MVTLVLEKQMGATETQLMRVKREECKRTKHGSDFSKWKVLVGPSDWEDHVLGKEGANRYRVHNLPTTSGPGVYELGIAVSGTDKLNSEDVVVVYLGQADSVRTRLQYYGRSGAHLNCSNHGSGCFEDVFSKGRSIVYRWAPMKNKADALKTERELLNTYDYAWNKGSNGMRRHCDALEKFNNFASNNIQFPKTIMKLLYFSQKPAGIKIKASKLPEEGHNFFSQIFKFTKSQPRLVLDRHGADEDHTGICGVSLDDGSVCRRIPVEGRKRCTQHKGLRISRSNPVKLPVLEGKYTVSEEHKRRETNRSSDRSSYNSREMPISTANQHYGGTCNGQPVKGRVRCEEQKSKSKGYDAGSSLIRIDNRNYCTSVCGAETLDGWYCRRPVKGNSRCWQHSKKVVNKGSTISSCNYWSSGGTSVCGAPTRNGSYCKRKVQGGGRCYQH